MKNNQIIRLIRMLLQSKGRRSPKLVIAMIALVIGYVLLQPILENRFGIQLPGFTQENASNNSEPPQVGTENRKTFDSRDVAETTPDQRSTSGEQEILDAFQARESDVMVQVTVTVKKILSDDNTGDRHQKAILRLSSGHTVLLAHNIDLANRVPYDEGDSIEVKGEYEYTQQGGVIHWTHHDPGRRHEDGWIRHNGQTYK